MAQLVGPDEIESFRNELAELGRNLRSSFRSFHSINSSVISDNENDEHLQLQWAAVERLPTFRRITTALFQETAGASAGHGQGIKRIRNVATLGAQDRQMFINKLIQHIEHDNLRLLKKLRKKIDK